MILMGFRDFSNPPLYNSIFGQSYINNQIMKALHICMYMYGVACYNLMFCGYRPSTALSTARGIVRWAMQTLQYPSHCMLKFGLIYSTNEIIKHRYSHY